MPNTAPADRREFFTLVARLPVAIYRTAPDGRIMMANQAMADLLGYESVAELQRLDAATLYADPGTRGDILDLFDGDVMPLVSDIRLRRRDGSTFWAQIRSHAIRDDKGLRYFEGTILDITEQKRAEELLRASEERFRTIFEHSPVGMSLRAADGKAEAVNPALCAMLGMSEDEVLLARPADLLAPDDVPRVEAAVQDLLAGRVDDLAIESHLVTKGGDTRTVLVHITRLATPIEGPKVLTQLIDVTDRRRIQDNLERLVRSKDQLVRSVSHELRTPLTAVVGFAEELEDRTDIDGAERQDLLAVIAAQSREMADLIEDLLTAAGADNGTLAVRTQVIDVVEACRDVIDAWRGVAPRLTVHPECGPAHADPFRLRQILRNLLTNAERYGEPPVELMVHNGSSTVTLQVRDRGVGLPPVDWEAIFEPYQRAHAENDHGGIGLGLSVSRQLARAMDGDLAYRVENGLSIFELTLPAAKT